MQMADQIIMRAVQSLIPYARNAQTHSDAQVAGSLREFGFTAPILIDDENGIIAGHGRVLAARKLGMTEVPCIEAAYLTPAQRPAYIIADNKPALNADWDEELLKLELGELKLEGFDLSLTGIGDLELGEPLAEKTEGPDRSRRCAVASRAFRRRRRLPARGGRRGERVSGRFREVRQRGRDRHGLPRGRRRLRR